MSAPKYVNGKRTAEYSAWWHMLGRCGVAKGGGKKAEHYIKRGITVCDRYASKFTGYESFYQDIGPKPFPHYILDRRDNEKGYIEGNIRWTDPSSSSLNTSQAHMITFGERTMNLMDWERETGIRSSLIVHRLEKLKWSIELALTTPVAPRDMI